MAVEYKFLDDTDLEVAERLADDEDAQQAISIAAANMEEVEKLKKEIETLKEDARELLEPVQDKYGVKGMVTDKGTLSFYIGTSTRMDNKKLQELLVKAGVKLSVVVDAMKKAKRTTTNENMTVSYKSK
jgi:hypothetical protein